MRAQYIIEAVSVLERAAEALCNFSITPEERGRLSAHCTMAAGALKWHSGVCEIEVFVDSVEVEK